jgi:cytochrome c5
MRAIAYALLPLAAVVAIAGCATTPSAEGPSAARGRLTAEARCGTCHAISGAAEPGQGEYEHLVIAAPPRLLKAIREKLSDKARSRIQAEIPKDLLKVSNHDIKAWLHAPGLL